MVCLNLILRAQYSMIQQQKEHMELLRRMTVLVVVLNYHFQCGLYNQKWFPFGVFSQRLKEKLQ